MHGGMIYDIIKKYDVNGKEEWEDGVMWRAEVMES